MGDHHTPRISRRAFTAGAAALAGSLLLPDLPAGAAESGSLPDGSASNRPLPDAPLFEQITLWDADVDPLENYHVHGLTVLPDDTVLAATEGRYETCDAGRRDILVRRSTDGGRTFGPTLTVIPSPNGESWGNPTFVVDRTTGEVFLFYMLSLRLPENTSCSGDIGDLYVTSSTDGGQTWAEGRSISGLFDHFPYEWALHGPGPGHGIQLTSGRLLLNVAHRRVIVGNTVNERYYGVSTIYSDDHGRTWTAGGAVPVSIPYPLNEARLVERSDGTVLVNARASSGGNRQRIVSVSDDGGTTWSDPKLDGATGVFNAVDASLLRYSGGPGSGELSRVLFSRPDAPVRRNLTVSVSYDDANSFDFSRVVTTDRAYYSDLARLSDGTIVLIFGCDGDIPSAPLRVRLARFNLEWLTSGRDSLARPVRRSERVIPFAALPPARGSSVTTRMVADPLARTGSRVDVSGTRPGDHLDYDINAHPGDYQVWLRYYRPEAGAAFEITVDKQQSFAATAFDAQAESAAGYQPAYLGQARLHGRHRIRVTATGPGRSGGTDLGLDSLILVAAPAPDVPNEVLVDNNEAGWQVVSGTWATSATGVQGAYSANYRHHPAGTGDAVVAWTPVVPVDGTYEIQASVLPFSNRATNAPYTVVSAGTSRTVTLNQQLQGEWDVRGTYWLSLGEFALGRGLQTSISLSDDADGYVAADAIRLIRKR